MAQITPLVFPTGPHYRVVIDVAMPYGWRMLDEQTVPWIIQRVSLNVELGSCVQGVRVDPVREPQKEE